MLYGENISSDVVLTVFCFTQNEPPEKTVGLAVGLVPKKGVLESGVFSTFLQNLFCLLMRLKLSFDMTPCKQDTRNSEGYVEMENVASYTWSYGESVIIDIGEDEHLFNVYGADYTLTPIDG